jgi:hypothetical protein
MSRGLIWRECKSCTPIALAIKLYTQILRVDVFILANADAFAGDEGIYSQTTLQLELNPVQTTLLALPNKELESSTECSFWSANIFVMIFSYRNKLSNVVPLRVVPQFQQATAV